MSENGWTKGPWGVFKFVVGDETRFHYVGCNRGGIADIIRKSPEQIKDAEANADLIAASPALAEALEACLGLLTGNMDGDFPADCDPVEMARDALALAKGRTV